MVLVYVGLRLIYVRMLFLDFGLLEKGIEKGMLIR